MFRTRSHSGERRSEAVVAAAQDPNSATTAADVAQTIVDESKKAGVAAYRFDPDASPEEKAAAAGASIDPSIMKPKKPTAVGVVTDLDTGAGDQYDLPAPSAEGAVSSAAAGLVDGQVGEDERREYVEKTGWAPRFGEGDLTEEEANASMLDHTTFLEGKLDDGFFGEWYHNAAVIVFACLASWVVAVLGGGLGWVFIVMATCGTYYRTSIRRLRRNFRDDVQREMAKARLETDTESLEWMNSFLVKFWPIYQPVLSKTIVGSVDQVLSTSTPAFLDSLRLTTFTLGTKPPRLDHVKTYPKAEDDIVLMDWKFSFTPGDRMDMTARQLKEKINPKVVLEIRIGKGVISKGLEVIVEDFAFSGLARVKVKLQLQFPHIERVEFCFLEPPTIDYVCKPLGGEHFGFDINFIPGLESFIKDQIHGNIGPMMYAPNVFPIEIAKMLAGSPVDQAIGVLAVTVHGAEGLKNSDLGSGTPDPYTLLSLNGRAELGRTKIVKQNASPRWNETKYIILTSLTDSLTLQVFDFNEIRKDKELGTASFALDRLETVAEQENLQLEILANGKPRGILQADLRFFPVLEAVKREDGTDEPAPESNTGIARFTVEQAKELDGTKSLVGQLNPYAILLLNGAEIHRTDKLKRTNQPIWQNASKEFLVTDRKAARLGLVIKDDRELGTDSILGAYQIRLEEMLRMMDQGKEWYNLSNAKTGRVKMLLQWKPVALRDAAGTSGGYITPIGVMRLHFQNARDLKNVETMGKSDPYVRVLLSGIEKARTVTFNSNLNPDWDEVVYVPMHSPRERLTLEVMDYQSIGKDRSLGYVELAAADYIRAADSGEFLAHDSKPLQSLPLRQVGRNTTKGTLNFTAAFYPTIPVIDPEEEEAAKGELEEEVDQPGGSLTPSNASVARSLAPSATRASASLDASRPSLDRGRPSIENDGPDRSNDGIPKAANERRASAGKIDTTLAQSLSSQGEMEQENVEAKEVPRIRLAVEDLPKHDTGLVVFKLISAELSRANVHLEVLMDDYVFPSYSSSKARSRTVEFGETGDAMVRELDMSRITMRLVEKRDKKGDGDGEENSIAKRTGETLQALQQCLYKPTDFTLTSSDGGVNKVRVSMKYLPIRMRLDPSESLNNMGTLRVDVLDATDLPAADRNGFSDPYCKFELNGETVFKTKVQKKTLHPSWNEYFEVDIPSRTAAKFAVRVMDWDFGDKADLLGVADINLNVLEPMQAKEIRLALDGKSGVVRIRLLFKSAYVTRSRQGSSTFSGTVGPAGKVIGAPVRGVTKVGTGVVKGASFIRRGFRGNGSGNGSKEPSPEPIQELPGPDGSHAAPPFESPPRQRIVSNGAAVGSPPPAAFASRPQSRAASIASASGHTGRVDTGTATFNVLSATGFPAGAKVQVHIRQLGSGKHQKDVLKTKAVKSATSEVAFHDEIAKVSCPPDSQFQIIVRDDKLFGSDDLGEALFFIDDSLAGSEKAVRVGEGTVTVRSSFVPKGGVADEDPAGTRGSPRPGRRSFLSKRE